MKTHRLQKLAENLQEQRQQNNAKGKGKRKFKDRAQTVSEEKKHVSTIKKQLTKCKPFSRVEHDLIFRMLRD